MGGSFGCVHGWREVPCVLVEATVGLTQVTALLRSLDLGTKFFFSFTSFICTYHGHNSLHNRATFWNLPFLIKFFYFEIEIYMQL